jgi:formate hydrogenlyase transcriptional activator
MTIEGSDIRNAGILVVDDQDTNIALLEQLLGDAGYKRVTSTTDPEAVCALHRKNRYDLILLDLQMPVLDGFQVMEGLKEIEPDGYLPVLVVTAQPGHKLRALKAGAKDFISKPFELPEVLARVRNMIEVRLLHGRMKDYSVALEQKVREADSNLAELEQSRNRYAALYDFAPVGYLTFDARGMIRESNLAGEQLLGIEKGQLVNNSLVGFIDGVDDMKLFFNHLENVMQNQGMQRCGIKLKGNEGTPVHVRLQSVKAETVGSRDVNIFSSIIDVTIAKQFEENIQHAREYAENIVEAVRMPLVVMDSGLKVLTVNHSFYDTFKVNPSETLGNSIFALGNRQWDIPELRDYFEDILAKDAMFNNFEVEHDFPGIRRRIFLLNARQVFRESIGSPHILLAMEDITERKRLGEELQNELDNLESAVNERTKELSRANVQLTQEINERKKAETSLQGTYTEIKRLKDRLQAENIYLQQEVDQEYNFGEIIGQSNALSSVFQRVEQVAPMNATVLLLGETGTGKGVVARAIHSCSTRKKRPLITVNCTTLPAALVEAELFGREKGAFTGSDARQIGRFELADGGTIFLDEIGEMPMELQSKLLRVIQDGEFERLGSPRTIKTDVRIIAATNRNLGEEIRNGRFREDLYYRLNVFPITMPPLRERKEDIPLLVDHFITKFNNKIGRKIATVSKEAMYALSEYHWPGNVRELESVIERAVITSQGTILRLMDRFETSPKPEEPAVQQDIKVLSELEHDHILLVLQKTGWRIEGKSGAAIQLGLNPSTLRARMRKYGILRK